MKLHPSVKRNIRLEDMTERARQRCAEKLQFQKYVYKVWAYSVLITSSFTIPTPSNKALSKFYFFIVSFTTSLIQDTSHIFYMLFYLHAKQC